MTPAGSEKSRKGIKKVARSQKLVVFLPPSSAGVGRSAGERDAVEMRGLSPRRGALR